MKTFFIVFTTPPSSANHGDLQTVFGRYLPYYEQLIQSAEARGLHCYLTFLPWYDRAIQRYAQLLTYAQDRWSIIPNTLSPQLIYDKTNGITFLHDYTLLAESSSHTLLCNQMEFTMLVSNKLYANVLFPDFFKPYHISFNRQDLQRLLTDLPGTHAVVKQALGNSGKQVMISSKEELAQQSFDYPVLVQEFIDSTAGIPGIMKGMHDLRVMCFDDRIIQSYIRQPAPGMLLANIAQGASVMMVELHRLPASVLEIVQQVQRRFQVFYPAIYTIDFIFDDKGRPWILEMNTKPGLFFPPGHEQATVDAQQSFLDFVETIIATL
jgi:glutathione synthase/RimK-type ligase-like ATP-grasp enzyme